EERRAEQLAIVTDVLGLDEEALEAAREEGQTLDVTPSPTLPGVSTLADVDPGFHEVTDVPAGLELRVRANPGIGQPIITTLPNGDVVATTGLRAQVGSTIWLQVELSGTMGWSSSAYLTATTAITDVAAEPVTPSEPSGPGITVLDTVSTGTHEVTDVPAGLELRVRSLPGIGQPQIGQLANGTMVNTTGRRAQVGETIWLELEFGTSTGWSSSFYLTEETEVVTGFSELVPEGEVAAIITEVALDADGDAITLLIGDDAMVVSSSAVILDADGRRLDHLAWADQRQDVSRSNPLIADVTIADGVIVELRQTAMI
ncbi:MAG: SH3 domain-containing protein, partial [Actinomycetota bacterium]